MSNLDVTQTPNPAPVDTPSIITNLNTDTGPQASPQSFGPDLNGLAQGLDSAGQDLQTTLYRTRFEREQTEAAQNSLWTQKAFSGLDKKYSAQQAQNEVTDQPVDVDARDATYQTDLHELVSSAPNQKAAAMLMAMGSQYGNGMYKSGLQFNVHIQQRQNLTQTKQTLDSIAQSTNDGSVSFDSARSQIMSAAAVANPALPMGAAPNLANAAVGKAAAGALSAVAASHGPAVTAVALRGGFGGNAFDDTTRELMATNYDNDQVVQRITAASLAQKNVDDLNARAAAGEIITPGDKQAAVAALTAATQAKPINTNPPSIADWAESQLGAISDWAKTQDPNNPTTPLKIATLQNITVTQIGRLINQRFAVLPPDQQRDQVQQLADKFGVGVDPAGNPDEAAKNPMGQVVRNAAQIVSENITRLTPGESYDPQGLAMHQPGVAIPMQNAMQEFQGAGGDATKLGQANADMKTALESSFTAQHLMGVPLGQERVLTLQQAKAFGPQLAEVDPTTGLSKAPALISQMQKMYPQYGSRVLSEIASASKLSNGAVMLGLLNPDSQKLWAAVNFKADPLKENDPNLATIKQQMATGNDTWNNYWKSQASDYGSAQRRQYMESAMPNMVRNYMAYGDDAATAFGKVVNDTIGNAYVTIPTNSGQQVSVPTTLTKSEDGAKSEMHKADILMNGLVQSVGLQGGPNNLQDQGTLTANNLSQGYWHFDTKNNAWARMVDNGKGVDVVRLTGGQPLMIDANKLQGRLVLQGTSTGWFGHQPDTLAGVHFGDIPAGTVGISGLSLLVQPPGAPDQSPILKATPHQPAPLDSEPPNPHPNPLNGGYDPTLPESQYNRPPKALPLLPGDNGPSYPNADSNTPDGETIWNPPGKSSASAGGPPTAPIAKTADYDPEAAKAAEAARAPGNLADHIESNLQGGLKGLGSTFVHAGQKYGIDPSLLASIAMHETGRGTSKALLEGNNAMGISPNNGGPSKFDSKEESINKMAHLLATLPAYAKFRKTGDLKDLADQYAPVGAPNDPRKLNGGWFKGVFGFLQTMR